MVAPPRNQIPTGSRHLTKPAINLSFILQVVDSEAAQTAETPMSLVRALFAAVALVLQAALPAPCNAAEPIVIRVALYPFVPDRYAVFTLLAQEFQCWNRG